MLLAQKTGPGFTLEMQQWLLWAIVAFVIGVLFWTLADIHRTLGDIHRAMTKKPTIESKEDTESTLPRPGGATERS